MNAIPVAFWMLYSAPNRFRPGLRPEPHGGANIVPPDPLSALRGPASKGEEKGRGREREGPAPISQIPGSAPD